MFLARNYRWKNGPQISNSDNSHMNVSFNNPGFSDADILYESISGDVRDHSYAEVRDALYLWFILKHVFVEKSWKYPSA